MTNRRLIDDFYMTYIYIYICLLYNPTSPLGVGGLAWCIIPKGRVYPPPYPAMDNPSRPFIILSHLISSYLTLPYLILSYLILSYLNLSYLILSYLIRSS